MDQNFLRTVGQHIHWYILFYFPLVHVSIIFERLSTHVISKIKRIWEAMQHVAYDVCMLKDDGLV